MRHSAVAANFVRTSCQTRKPYRFAESRDNVLSASICSRVQSEKTLAFSSHLCREKIEKKLKLLGKIYYFIFHNWSDKQLFVQCIINWRLLYWIVFSMITLCMWIGWTRMKSGSIRKFKRFRSCTFPQMLIFTKFMIEITYLENLKGIKQK